MCSLEVAYIGWYAYGAEWQLECGSYSTCRKPFARLAVIEPVSPVVRSCRTTWKPADVSCMSSTIVSPGFMKRSVLRSGVVAANGGAKSVSGSGEACGTPLLVMKAKLTGSLPTFCRHCWFWVVLSTCETLRLSIVSAAHH